MLTVSQTVNSNHRLSFLEQPVLFIRWKSLYTPTHGSWFCTSQCFLAYLTTLSQLLHVSSFKRKDVYARRIKVKMSERNWSQHFPGQTEDNHENLRSDIVSGMKIHSEPQNTKQRTYWFNPFFSELAKQRFPIKIWMISFLINTNSVKGK